MNSSTLNNCQTCGAPLDPDNPEPLCPGCVFAEALAPTPDSPAPGTIGGHLIIEEIARGGMGVVYLAKQKDPDRLVALKTLRASALSSPEALRRFRQEARAMASLDHPAILPVHQFGEQDGVPFFTMKLATGGTLEKRLSRFSGQWRDIAALMAIVADAVQHAHAHTLLHRDLKPANILFDEENRPYVADFGIAKLLDGDTTDNALTKTSAVLGTPNYLSPEVAAKDARNATTASDVWSLGVILYQLLAQKLPFQGDFIPEVLTAILRKDPPAIPDAPRDLTVIALKALSKEPQRRYATARDLAEDLRRWLEGKPITARATTTIERMNLWAKRSPALAALTCLAVLAAVTAVGALYWAYEAGERGVANVLAANLKAEANLVESQKNLRQSLLEQARAGRTSNLAGWRAKGLEAIRQAAAIKPGPDLRDEAIAHLAGFDLVEKPLLPDAKSVRQSQGATRPVRTPPTIIAKSESETSVAVLKASGEQIGVIKDLPGSGKATHIASPDGRWIVQINSVNSLVRLLDAQSLSKSGEWTDHYFVGFNRDSTQVLLAEKSGKDAQRLGRWKSLLAVNLPDLTPASNFKGPPAQMAEELASDTFVTHFSTIGQSPSLQFWDTTDLTQRTPFQISLDSEPAKAVKKGDWLAVGTMSGRIYLCRHSQRQVFPLVFHEGQVRDLRFSEDGLYLTTLDEENTIAIWQTDTQALLARFLGHRLSGQQVFAQSWDSWVEDTYDGVHELAFSPPPVLRIISEHRGLDTGGRMDFSPDGRWLCSAGDQRLALFEVATGKLVFTGLAEAAECALFSADSKYLYLQESKDITLLTLSIVGDNFKSSAPKSCLLSSRRFSVT